MKRILALDPGGTTGWATWTDEPGSNTHWGEGPRDEHFNVGEIGPHDHHKELADFLGLQQTHDFTIVCESFEFRQNRQRDNINLMSREYIGVIKHFAQDRMSTPVVFQTAGKAKPFVTDAKLKVMGLWWPGKKHAMDAMRHLITYMVQQERRYDLIESWEDM